MKKNLCFALMTFYLSACSAGSGSGSQGEAIGNSQTYSAEKRTVIIPTVGTLSDLETESGKRELFASIQSRSNISAGSCSNSSSSICSSNTPAGALLGSYGQSYSGYAFIRNDYQVDENGVKLDSEPANVFVAVVGNPTTDANAIVDATYKGIVSYSRQNTFAVISRDTLTMTVKDNQISGVVTQTTGSGVTTNVITFNPTDIVATSENITFSGDAVFRQNSFYSDKEYEGDVTGRYQGIFAGAQAQEVVGTFHSHNTGVTNEDGTINRLASVQGAFAATKE